MAIEEPLLHAEEIQCDGIVLYKIAHECDSIRIIDGRNFKDNANFLFYFFNKFMFSDILIVVRLLYLLRNVTHLNLIILQ